MLGPLGYRDKNGEMVGVMDYAENLMVAPLYDQTFGLVLQGNFLNKDLINRPKADIQQIQMRMGSKLASNATVSSDYK